MRVLVAALELQREVASQAEPAQRVEDLVGVGADVRRPLAHILDELVEAGVEVVEVGDLAQELEEGLAVGAVQRALLTVERSWGRYHRAPARPNGQTRQGSKRTAPGYDGPSNAGPSLPGYC